MRPGCCLLEKFPEFTTETVFERRSEQKLCPNAKDDPYTQDMLRFRVTLPDHTVQLQSCHFGSFVLFEPGSG